VGRWEDSKGGKGQELYIGPISSSEHAPYVAFSVTEEREGKKLSACGGLSSMLRQIPLK